MSADTLQVLRNILQDLGERVSMACYIDNILRELLKEHKELLNNAIAKHRRKVAIDFWTQNNWQTKHHHYANNTIQHSPAFDCDMVACRNTLSLAAVTYCAP